MSPYLQSQSNTTKFVLALPPFCSFSPTVGNLAWPEICNHTVPTGRGSGEDAALCLALEDGILTDMRESHSRQRVEAGGQSMMMCEPTTGKEQIPTGLNLMQHVVHEGDFTCGTSIQFFSARQWTAWHFGLGSGRTKAMWAWDPRANGLGRGENEASVVRQGGRGQHSKGAAGRKGIIEEPTELGKWQKVEKVRKRKESK